MAECKWMQDEVCVNADCPMRADFCPVPDIEGVCRYEDRMPESGEVKAIGGVVREEADRLAKVFAVSVGKNADIICSELSKKISIEFDRIEKMIAEGRKNGGV